jgi:hypothetical protein
MGSAPSATLARLMAEDRAADKLAKGAEKTKRIKARPGLPKTPRHWPDHGIDKHLEAPARRRHGRSSPRQFMSGKTRF